MEDKKISELAKRYGTPLYIYDSREIDKSFQILRDSLPRNSKIYYSLKCNPLMGICKYLYNKGCCIEVASAGELFLAIKSGVLPENILFTSPCKTIDEITYSIEQGIGLINVESFEEIKMINEISLQKNCKTKILLRINPDFKNNSSTVKMSGVSSQFGIEESNLNQEFFNQLKLLNNIILCGIQVYMGTQILDYTSLCENFKYIISLGKRLSKEFDFNLEYLDCGGGFGVKYFSNEKDLEPNQLNQLKNDLEYDLKEIPNTTIIFESGRFLLANSGSFVTAIKYIKESKGKKYYVCDGGMNLFSSAAFLGRFIRNNFPIRSLSNCTETEIVNITGPLCTPTDLLGQNITISKSTVNEYVVIGKAGAYGLTYSPVMFLSHGTPREIMTFESNEILLREKSSYEDLLINQRC